MEKRKDYETEAAQIVQQLKFKIEKLEEKAEEAQKDTEARLNELKRKREQLNKQRVELNRRFEELTAASDEEWEKLVSEFEIFIKEVNADKLSLYETMEEWFEDMSEKIRHLEKQAASASSDAKETIDREIIFLKEQRDKLGTRLSELRESSSDNWERLKQNLDEGMTSLKDQFNKVYNKMKS
jgi:chromosome segregation ATPase